MLLLLIQSRNCFEHGLMSTVYYSVMRIRIRIRIVNADPDPGGQNYSKMWKNEEILFFEMLDVLLEGWKLLLLLGRPSWRHGNKKMHFWSKNRIILFSSEILLFLVIQALDGSALKPMGTTRLLFIEKAQIGFGSNSDLICCVQLLRKLLFIGQLEYSRVSDVRVCSSVFEKGSIDPACSQLTLFVLLFCGVQMTRWTTERRQG